MSHTDNPIGTEITDENVGGIVRSMFNQPPALRHDSCDVIPSLDVGQVGGDSYKQASFADQWRAAATADAQKVVTLGDNNPLAAAGPFLGRDLNGTPYLVVPYVVAGGKHRWQVYFFSGTGPKAYKAFDTFGKAAAEAEEHLRVLATRSRRVVVYRGPNPSNPMTVADATEEVLRIFKRYADNPDTTSAVIKFAMSWVQEDAGDGVKKEPDSPEPAGSTKS